MGGIVFLGAGSFQSVVSLLTSSSVGASASGSRILSKSLRTPISLAKPSSPSNLSRGTSPCRATCRRILYSYTPEGGEVDRLSWEIDGRRGRAKIGAARLDGFALMRDATQRRIAFQVATDIPFDAPSDEPPTSQFVIDEDAFEPVPDPESC
jgi:hypothetical protein